MAGLSRIGVGASLVCASGVGVVLAIASGHSASGDGPTSSAEAPAEALKVCCAPASLRPATSPSVVSVGATEVTTSGMVLIPGGEFTMGTDDADSLPNERPARRVNVAGFWIDATPVTNAQFRKFVDATGYVSTAEKAVDWEELRQQVAPGTPKPADEMLQPGSLVFTPPGRPVDLRDLANWWAWTPGANWRHPQGPGSDIEGKDDHPVVQVSWDDAVAYARWAGKRLPTEVEWEYAARGAATTDTRYIWGDTFLPGGRHAANTFTGHFPYEDTAEDGYAGTSPVMAFLANGHGLFDMAGNVWQWTADAYRQSPESPPDQFQRVIKGGSYLCHESYCESYRPTARRGTPYDTSTGHVGFRCAMSVTKDPSRSTDR